MINNNIIEQEMEQEEQMSKINDTSKETNPYHELIVNNAEKIETIDDTNRTMVNFEQHLKLCATWQISFNKTYIKHKGSEQI